MGSRVAVCNCVAFRLDDIQDYFLNQAQMQVIETFEDRNASLTIGVIANYTGDDQVLLSFLKEKLESENFSIDVANHGMNHEDFSLLEREVQSDLLAAANEQIMATLGVQPSVFITPFNRMNEDTLLAMAENNLNIVSAGLETVAPYVRNVTSSAGVQVIHHFPRTAETGDISSDGTSWVGSNHNKTMQDIRESIDKYGYAVVMMHPQEFSVREGINFENIVDSDQLAELELLLDAVMQEGYSIRTVSELARYRTVPEFSVFALIAAGIGVAVFWALGKSAKFRGHLPL
jgi:peptidoglycan/xylan/chitin deacetylase (PgdA/CDA1 family)